VRGTSSTGGSTPGSAPPAGDSLLLSADPAFRGQAAHLNPEQLVVLAAASCQLLSFLAVAARARLDVVAYEADAEGVMPEGDHPVRLTGIVLRPRIVLAAGPTEQRVRHLVDVAHRECPYRGAGGERDQDRGVRAVVGVEQDHAADNHARPPSPRSTPHT